MIEAGLVLLLGVVVILLIIAANGYFVAQEFAYMSVDRVKLEARAESGDAAARRALKVTRRTSFMLSGAQLGITITGLLIGYVAEPLIGESLGVLLGGAGVPAALSISVGTVLALSAATIVQMIFGELYPKNLAIASPERLARGLARSTTMYLTVFGWLITVFDHAANALLRVLRIEPVHDVDTTATAKDLERIVAESRDSGDLSDDLSIFIDRVLDFPDRNVAHAMIPRIQVGTVAPETTVGRLRVLMANGHSRYPVVSRIEEPVGVVQLVDLLRAEVSDDAVVETLMRPPLVLPTLMSLPDALTQLTRSRNQIACVVDEYGGFAGVLTIEDLAEELVGELTDEHDEVVDPVIQPEGSTWKMPGDVHLDEVQRTVGYRLPDGDYETLSGLFLGHFGELPHPGDTVQVDVPEDGRDFVLDKPVSRVLDIEVLAVARRVPSELRIRLVTSAEASDVENGDSVPGNSDSSTTDGR